MGIFLTFNCGVLATSNPANVAAILDNIEMVNRSKNQQATAPTLADINMAEAHRLCAWLLAEGCFPVARVLPDGSVAGMSDLIFTRSITLGCTRSGWTMRYCFEDRELANQRFAELQSEDDVPQGAVANRLGLSRM